MKNSSSCAEHRRAPLGCWSMLLLGVLICAVGGCLSPGRRPVHTKDDFVGSWTGFSQDLSYTCRLVLRPDQNGVFAFKFDSREAAIYRVVAWDLDKGRILADLRPIRPYTSPFKLTIEGRWYNRLDATIASEGTGSKWRINARLLRDSFVNDRIRSIDGDLDGYEQLLEDNK